MLLQLGLEALEQRKRIRRPAGKPGQNPAVIQTPHLLRRPLDDDIAQRNLPIPPHRHRIAPAHGKNGRAVILLHERHPEREIRRVRWG